MEHPDALSPASRIIDDKFDRSDTRTSTLCLLLRPHRLAYAVHDSTRNKFTVQHTSFLAAGEGRDAYLKDLRTAIAQDDLLHLPYQRTVIALGQGPSVLVPQALHEADQAGRFLGLQYQLPAHFSLVCEALDDMDAVLEGALDSDLLNYLHGCFGPSEIHHADAVLLCGQWRERPEEGAVAYAHIEREAFAMTVFVDGTLRYFNRFTIKAKEDFLYFVLLVLGELDLDRNQTPLIIQGEAVRESGLFALADRYLDRVEFGRRPKGIRFNRNIREMPGQFHYTLYNLPLCAS